MKNWHWRVRYLSLLAAGSGLLAFNGCGLSDRQLASIWQSVLATGLSAIVSNAITAWFEAVSNLINAGTQT